MNKTKSKNIFIILLSICIFSLLLVAFFRSYDSSFYSQHNSIEETSNLRVLVTGDMMLDRNVRKLIDRDGFDKFFVGVKDMISKVDVAVTNLEGPFTNNPSLTVDLNNKELVFTFDPSLAPALADLGFDVMGLANNHTYNFGREGLESTRRYIGSSGMLYYGDPFNKDEISTVIIKNGIKVGFVGFHEFYYTNFEKVYAEIVRLRKEVDVLIVTPHWGVEYQTAPTTKMSEWAHQFIELGADVVIGSHPHIVGDIEEYMGKKIYYSLGNFVFDQYFSKATMNGLVVVVDIQKKNNMIELMYKDIPIVIDRHGVSLTSNDYFW